MILQVLFQVLVFLLSSQTKSMAKEPPSRPLLTKPNCRPSCGNNVEVPFPFGIGEDCYLDESYAVECRSNKPVLRSIALELLNISLQRSTIQVYQPVASSCQDEKAEVSSINLENVPFYFFLNDNYFFGVGCNSLALIASAEVNSSVFGGCFSFCNPKNKTEHDKYCGNGINCCETRFSQAFKSLKFSVDSIKNGTRTSSKKQECRYAFLLDLAWYRNNTTINSTKYFQNWKETPVALGWGLSNSSYDKLALKISPTFGSTFNCVTDDAMGLKKCRCRDGYQGNPYLSQGCQDVDECKRGKPEICPSNMVCKNHVGGYRCISSKMSKVYEIILGIGTGLGGLVFLTGAWRLCMKIRKRMKKKEQNFKRNGGLLLQQQLNSSHGSVHRCKIFSSHELNKATDHFNVDRIVGQGGQGTVYKGILPDGRIIAVKKSEVVDREKLQEFINEVVILSQINHRNVVKLLGGCLETKIPLLVYEFIPNGTLFQYLHDQHEEISLTWERRLRIVTEVAEALSYLHFEVSLPIYHRDIKSTNILLDEKYRAKIADFGISRWIAIDQTHVTTKVQGTFGYLDPEYFQSSQFTEKSDVYSFGVVLVELLTRQKTISSIWEEEDKTLATFFVISMEENRLFDIIDAQIRGKGKEEEIMEVANVARNCLNPIGKNRPTMKEVAIELERIRASTSNASNAQQNYEEAEYVRSKVFEPWDIFSTSTFSTLDNTTRSE